MGLLGPRASPDGATVSTARRRRGRPTADPDLPARLAAEGRYAEAIHALLLLAIQRHASRLDPPPPESATSREVLRVLPLEGPAREALRELVAEVELSLFGGRAVDEEGYQRCLRSFETLAGIPG